MKLPLIARYACVAAFVPLVACSMFGQAEPSIPTPPQPVVINFIGEVNYDSVDRLLKTVTEQINKGNHDITILIGSGGGNVETSIRGIQFFATLADADADNHV